MRSTSETSGRDSLTCGTDLGTVQAQKPGEAPLRWLASIVPRSLAAALLVALSVSAQSPGIPAPGLERSQSNSRFPMQPPIDTPGAPNGAPNLEARRMKALNELRHKAMVDDASKLLTLARELHDDAQTLSPAERLRKTGEIEKLAKSVKDKMSYSVGNEQVSPVFTITSP